MWKTTFKHDEVGVEEMTHDFGNGVRIVTNLRNKTVRRYHGDVLIDEWMLNGDVGFYMEFLVNVESEQRRKE